MKMAKIETKIMYAWNIHFRRWIEQKNLFGDRRNVSGMCQYIWIMQLSWKPHVFMKNACLLCERKKIESNGKKSINFFYIEVCQMKMLSIF